MWRAIYLACVLALNVFLCACGLEASPASASSNAGEPSDGADTVGGVPLSQRAVSLSSIRELFRVYWAAPFMSGGGYCSEATAFAQVLHLLGADAAIAQHGDSFNADYTRKLSDKNVSFLRSLYVDSFYDWTRMNAREAKSAPLTVVVCHSEPGAWDAPSPRYATSPCPPPQTPAATTATAGPKLYRIGRTMFETDRVPSGWIDRLNFMDEVWVPTTVMRDIFVSNGVEPGKVRVVAEPVDTDFFRPGPHTFLKGTGVVAGRDTSSGGGATHFLFVGKWEERKGLLLRSFLKEFRDYSADNPVARLTILTSAYHSTDQFWLEIQKFVASEQLCDMNVLPRIVTVISNVPSDDMPQLYRSVHALVVPSRGEGWGRPHSEAMACGVPVVATNWSGTTAFIDDTVGYPLTVSKMVPAAGWKGHYWAEPSEVHLRELLRRIVAFPEEAARKGARARLRMVRSYSLPAMGAALAAEICRILLSLLLPSAGPAHLTEKLRDACADAVYRDEITSSEGRVNFTEEGEL